MKSLMLMMIATLFTNTSSTWADELIGTHRATNDILRVTHSTISNAVAQTPAVLKKIALQLQDQNRTKMPEELTPNSTVKSFFTEKTLSLSSLEALQITGADGCIGKDGQSYGIVLQPIDINKSNEVAICTDQLMVLKSTQSDFALQILTSQVQGLVTQALAESFNYSKEDIRQIRIVFDQQLSLLPN